MKTCPKCSRNLDEGEFHKSSRRKDGLQIWCKKCSLDSKNRRYWEGRKPAVRRLARAYTLKKNYGISLEEYDQLYEAQGGVCAICKKPETQKSSTCSETVDSLSVDHCHRTGAVRGLLCSKCNFGLGHFGDNIELVFEAASYLINSLPEYRDLPILP